MLERLLIVLTVFQARKRDESKPVAELESLIMSHAVKPSTQILTCENGDKHL
jgi:hypothetical protein